MSNIVYDANARAQHGHGRYKPHADLSKHAVTWAVVDGDEGGGYMSAAELSNVGEPIGTEGKGFLRYEEYKGKNGKPHDIKVGGRTLREMIAPREDAIEKNKLEARESVTRTKNFLDAQDLKSRMDATGTNWLSSELTDKEEIIERQHEEPKPK